MRQRREGEESYLFGGWEYTHERERKEGGSGYGSGHYSHICSYLQCAKGPSSLHVIWGGGPEESTPMKWECGMGWVAPRSMAMAARGGLELQEGPGQFFFESRGQELV